MFRFQGQTEIKIGGKKRPVCLCMNQIGEFTALYNGGFAVFDAFLASLREGNFNYIQYRDFVYTALKWGVIKKGLEPEEDLTAINVGFWIEEMEDEDRINFNNCFELALVNYSEDVKKKTKAHLKVA